MSVHAQPAHSSLPRQAAATGAVMANSGVGNQAASMLPAITHVKKIGERLDQTLKQSRSTLIRRHSAGFDVYDQIRGLLDQYMQEEQLDRRNQEEVVRALQHAGLFGDLVSGGVGPQLAFGTEESFNDPSVAGAAAAAALPGGGRLQPNRRYLSVRVRPGRAFVDQIMDDAEAKVGGFHVLRLVAELRGNRCASAPVPATVEPQFNEQFLFPLQGGGGFGDGGDVAEGMLSMESLAELRTPLHLVVVRESSLGSTSLVASHSIEWRKVLVHGRLSLNVELKGGDELATPVGLLSLDLEIVPLRMPPNPRELPVFVELAAINKQLASDAEMERGIATRFHAYARAWWSDYNAVRPLHQTRLIQIFGLDEERQQRCVCAFLSPLRADRCLDSPLHAARFVRLIPYRRETRVGGARAEVWHRPATILARRAGDLEDHVLLLCSLLLGFGLDAYVAVGTAAEKGAHMWVLTRGTGPTGGVTMWESLTGQRWELDDAIIAHARALHGSSLQSAPASGGLPFQRLHCLFNHRSLYANNQLEDSVALLDYNLTNPSSWRAMNERAIEVLPRSSAGGGILLRAPALDARSEERALEHKLRELVVQYRREYANLSTAFSEDLSYLLGPALASYESERVTGAAFGNELFQAAVKRTVPTNCVFRAVPFQLTSLNASVVFAAMLANRALVDLLTSDGGAQRFGLRVRVVAYPEDFLAVWLALASVKQAGDFMHPQ